MSPLPQKYVHKYTHLEVSRLETNLNIRKLITQYRLRYWEVAAQVGISDSRLSVWLRTPLSDERKARVEKAIEELTKQTTE